MLSDLPILTVGWIGVALTVPRASQPRLYKTEQRGTLLAAAHNPWERRWRRVAFLEPLDGSRNAVSEPLCFGLSRDFCNRCLLWFLRSRTKVDLNFFYLASFHGEELRVPGAPAILGFAIVEDEGFVAFLKQLLNAIRWGFLAIRATSV
jgi:hypothetical protein